MNPNGKPTFQNVGFRSSTQPTSYAIYSNLAKIAHAPGDAEAAARWQAKYEAKLAELERRRRGDGSTGL